MWSLLSLRVPELPTRLLVSNGGCLLGQATVTARRARPPGKRSDRLTPASSVGPTGPERLVPPPLSRSVGAGQAVVRVSPGVIPPSQWPVPHAPRPQNSPGAFQPLTCTAGAASLWFLWLFLRVDCLRGVGTASHRAWLA